MSSSDPAAERDKLLKAYQDVFSTESGKMVLFDMMRRYRVFSVHYLPSDQLVADGMGMALRNAWNQGQRSVVVEIMSKLNQTLNDALEAHEEMGDVDNQSRDRGVAAQGSVGSEG